MKKFVDIIQDIRNISADMHIMGADSERNNNTSDIKVLNEILDILQATFTFMDFKTDDLSQFSLEFLTRIATIDFEALQTLYKWYSEIPAEVYFSYQNYDYLKHLNEFMRYISDNIECIRQYINDQTKPLEE